MIPRAKVKILIVVSAMLVCLYLALPVLIGHPQPRHLDAIAGKSQSDVTSLRQESLIYSSSGANGNAGSPRSSLLVNGAARQQSLDQTRHGQNNIFANLPNQPVHNAVVLQQGIPHQGFGSNQGIPQQGVSFNKGVPQQGVGSNPGNPQKVDGPNKVISPQGAKSNIGNPQENIQQNVGSNQSNLQQKPSSREDGGVDQTSVSVWIAGQLGLHADVKIVSSNLPAEAETSKIECVPLPKSPREKVKICIYSAFEDKWVSGSLKMNKLWEEDLVLSMQRALQADPAMMLLDLGSNLGIYALFAAAMGRSVLAVEMLPSNVMMIQKSLTLSGLGGKVLIVNNALYRDHRTLETRFMQSNIGGSRLNTSKVYEHVDTRRPAVSVRTICLDDLSPLLRGRTVYMKIDIENSEHHALACAHKLFTEVNVKVVQIEWLHRTPEESSLISEFMTSHGYAMSQSALSHSPVDSKHIKKADVYFIKKSAFNIS